MKFATALLSVANAVQIKQTRQNYAYDNPAYYYGSYGGYNNGFVDDFYDPSGVLVGPPGSYNPAYGGYIYVDFPTRPIMTSTDDNRDSPSDSYDLPL